MKKRILVIDDEASIRKLLSIFLEDLGCSVMTADSVASGMARLKEQAPDLVMCDLKLPDGNGLELLSFVREQSSSLPFIIITAHTTPENALESMRAGATEYISKPFIFDELRMILKELLSRKKTEPELGETDLVSKSPAMLEVSSLIPRIAKTPSTVLISGESGVGKEVVARTIHQTSPRADGPFLSVNCGALPEGLLESELFGHVRGSFTGAVRDHKGLFAEAARGTLFLDEITELTLPMQVKLLRVLQNRMVRPVGGHEEIPVDTRVLAATNRHLAEEVREGRFREDLYYRLNVVSLQIPPLRRRPEDLPILARHFVSQYCRAFEIPEKTLSEDAIRVLRAYDWPGNVRELENVIERTVALTSGSLISSGSLPAHLRGSVPEERCPQYTLPEEGMDLEEYLDGLRAGMMRQALEKTGGNQKEAAKLLRMTYRAFRYHAEKIGLSHSRRAGKQGEQSE